MKFGMKRNEAGFSLVELMIVVGIIGILASLAMPKMQVFMAKARQTEGKGIITNIYALQQSYFTENNTFNATPATIGYVHNTGSKWNAPTIAAGAAGIATSFTSSTTNAVALCTGVAVGANTISGNELGAITAPAPACN
jgi:type IV pilus assembly protein PilA